MWNFGVELDDARMGSTWVCSSAMVPKNTIKNSHFKTSMGSALSVFTIKR